MNKIINNLPQVADAIDYFSTKSSSWRVRSCIVSMAVWAAHGYVKAEKTLDAEKMVRAAVRLATIRSWARDVNTNSLSLWLTPADTEQQVRRSLGLDRKVDLHEEASREARFKCQQARSARNFKKYYDEARAQFEIRLRERNEMVEQICELLYEQSFNFDHEMADYMTSFCHQDVRPGAVSDNELYDEGSVERELDTLSECLANALESMATICDDMLAASITREKVNRLLGYQKGINHMMEIVGIDKSLLAKRNEALAEQIEAAITAASITAASIDADIEAQLAEMPQPEPVEPVKPKRTRVKAASAA